MTILYRLLIVNQGGVEELMQISCWCELLFDLALMSADKPPRIMPEEERQHVGQPVEVVCDMKGAKNSMQWKTVYLNSESDFRVENLRMQFPKKRSRL